MRKALIFILLLFSAHFLQAQSHLFVKGGTAYSYLFDFPGFESFESEFGIQTGFLYSYNFRNNFNFKTELLYNGQLPKKSTVEEQRLRLKFHYFSLPVIAGYRIGKFNIELGPEVYLLMNKPDKINRFKYGALAGVSYNVIENFVLNFRYSLLLNSISHTFFSNDGNEIRQVNFITSSTQLTLAYKLFKKND